MPESQDYFRQLVELMDVLRGPGGCPWDKEQTPETLMPMLIEEAYEVLDALDKGDPDELCEELGDLLFQIIFQSRIAQEEGAFDAYEVCRRVHQKMVGRHPHIFGEESFEDAQELLKAWEDIKSAEKAAAGNSAVRGSLLEGIPNKLPAMYKTLQMTEKASRVGFDWSNLEGIQEKLLEELDELQSALATRRPEKIKEEVGDVLFTALNIARFLSIDPETALRRANNKFLSRFQAMEQHFREQGDDLKTVELEAMEAFWQTRKARRSDGAGAQNWDELQGEVTKDDR